MSRRSEDHSALADLISYIRKVNHITQYKLAKDITHEGKCQLKSNKKNDKDKYMQLYECTCR